MRFDIAIEGIDATLAGLDMADRAVALGVVGGLNKIGAKGVTQSVRSITGMFNIKARDVKQGVSLTRARLAGGRSRGRMFASIRAKAGSFPLFNFGGLPREPVSQAGIPRGVTGGKRGGGKPYPGRKRVSIKMRKQGSRLNVEHGFLVRMRSGRVGIFERTSASSRPIREMRSVGVAGMFKMSAIVALKRLMRTEGPAILRREIAFRLGRIRAKGV